MSGAKVILASATDAAAMNATLDGLGINGRLVIVGAGTQPLLAPARLLIGGRRTIMGWPSGTALDSQETMAFSAACRIRPMTDLFPLDGAAEAYERLMSGKARFRVVLTTD